MKVCFLIFLLLGGDSLSAAIVYGSLAGRTDNEFTAGKPDRVFDFDGDGRGELQFIATGLGTSTVIVDPLFRADVRVYEGRGVAVLGYGTVIDVNPTLFSGTNFIEHGWAGGTNPQLMSYFHSGGSGGPWNRKTGYLGVFFVDPEFTVHYGWMHIRDYGGTIEFLEWAYETEDRVPIFAGQVPEPSTSTGLLAALLGISLRRRRHREAGMP